MVKKTNKKKKAKYTFVKIDSFLKKYVLPLPENPIIPFDIKKYSYLNEIETIIGKIQSIISNPRTHLIANKEARNIETVIKIDNSDLKETAQRGKHWNRHGNKTIPEEIFSDVFDTDLSIYENKFIVLLINKLFAFTNIELRHLYDYIESISNNYQIKETYIASIGEINKLSNVSSSLYKVQKRLKEKSFLTKDELPLFDTLERLLNARKNLSHIMASRFYKTVKLSKPLGDKDVHPTNILVGDSTYSPCYHFYLKLKKISFTKKRVKKVNKVKYSNYVVYSLLKDLKKLKFVFKTKRLKIVNKKIVLKKFIASNRAFKLTINSDTSHIELLFKLSLKNKRLIKTNDAPLTTTNKVSLVLMPNINTNLYSVLIDDIISKRLNKGYNNAFVITPYISSNSESVVICSPYNKKIDSNILNMLKSTTLISEGNEFIYSHLCPVCGNAIAYSENVSNYICPICSSTYSTIKAKAKNNLLNLVWIKRICSK